MSLKGEVSASAEIANKCLLHTHGFDDRYFDCSVTDHQDSTMTLCRADTHATSMSCVTPADLCCLGNKLVSRMHTACHAQICRQELCFASHCFVGALSIIYTQHNVINLMLMWMYVLCRSAFSLGLDADLPPLQGSSSQTFGDSLQQRYFPPVHSAPTSSLFTHAPPPGPLFRQGWGAVDHGGQHTQQGGLTHLLPHNSAPPTFGGTRTEFSQALQPPSLFQLAQGDQQRSSVFGHGDQQRDQGMHHMGQLEQHYLRHLQSAGTIRTGSTNPTGGSLLAPGPRPPNLQPSWNLDWMERDARQLGTLARLGQAAAFDPNAQVAMNLEELSALLQAGQAHQTVQQPQPPQTLAQTYLTRLRANSPMRTQSGPLLGSSTTGQSHYSQSSSFTGWGHMQMPQLQLQGMHHLRDPVPSASEPRLEGLLQGSVLGNDVDALNEPPQDDPDLFRTLHPS